MKTQVPAETYQVGYVSDQRWMSYYHQIRCIQSCNPKSVLEIGSATLVVANYFKTLHPAIKYEVVDIDPDLRPDYVGEVTKLPIADSYADVVCAFQVLEHLPFDHFNRALSELARASKRYVIISLPHYGSHLRFECKLPVLPRVRFSYKFSWPRKEHTFDGEHYWEIGKRGFSKAKVINKIEEVLRVKDHFIPYENQFHHFFVLEKK